MSDKYIIWTSPNTGDYVKADQVEEFDGKVIFIQVDGVVGRAVAEYSLDKIQEYHKVKV